MRSDEGALPQLSGRPFWLVLLSSWVLLLVSLVVALAGGSVWLDLSTVMELLLEPAGISTDHRILWAIRLPRVLLAAVVGASLAAVGVALQALVRNPLADPYILGSSSGASAGAAMMLLLGWPSLVPPFAFAGALLALWLAQGMARQGSRLPPDRLLLAGVAIGYMLGAVTSLLAVIGDPTVMRGILFWLLGGFSAATWSDLTLPSVSLILGGLYLMTEGRRLNALTLGDEASTTLGVDADRVRWRLLLLAAVMTGLCVAVSGAIGFVGLMVPHLVRRWVGADHRRLLPTVMAVGGVLLVVADLVARTAFLPRDLPVGILTALAGGPFFLTMMRRVRS